MDLVFGSQWLIDELCSLGFSISYDKVNTLKQSILQDQSVDCFASAELQPNQFVDDNADSNVQTLDGLGTFHALGMIQISKLKKKELDYERVKRMARIHVSSWTGPFLSTLMKMLINLPFLL